MKSTLPVLLLVSLAIGCDRHQPSVRPIATAENPSNPHGMPSGSFHGDAAPGMGAALTGPEVDLGVGQLTAPEGWIRKAPRVEFIRAEFTLPRAEGDPADGRLTVSTAGGTLQDNLKRWRDQFGGKPEKDSQEELTVEGVRVTLVDFSGKYQDQQSPMMAASEAAGYRMMGAVFALEGKMYFIKAYGPAKTIAAQAAKFRAFVQSLKAKK